jgi:hypothetical protein
VHVVLAASQDVPLYVPLVFGVPIIGLFFGKGRDVWRDPDAYDRRVAEARARSRVLHPFGGGDVEREFEGQRRFRWITRLALIGYVVGTLTLLIAAIAGIVS